MNRQVTKTAFVLLNAAECHLIRQSAMYQIIASIILRDNFN